MRDLVVLPLCLVGLAGLLCNLMGSPRVQYWAAVAALVVINALAVVALFEGGANSVVLAVLALNLMIFVLRAGYVGRHDKTLFKESNHRSFVGATTAERVALYVLVVMLTALLMEAASERWGWGMDSSLTDIGESVLLLAVGAPVVTYLTSGFGKLRHIVRGGQGASSSGDIEAED